jgi:DNA/RNA-binding domain of Phe-tRNA-synthetase-like protein
VDLTNLLSLRFQVCFGLYDLAHLQPPLEIALGGEGDRYQGIRKETLSFAGKIVLRDGQGAFGNPSADSLRASVSGSSRDVLQVLFFHPDDEGRREILASVLADFKVFFAMGEYRSFFI